MNEIREDDLKYIIKRIPYAMCEGKTFLITGANGFLASYLVDTLMYLNKHMLQNKCKVVALCRNKEKAEERLQEWLCEKNFKLLIQSVEDEIPDSIEADYVIHAASNSATADFEKSPADLLRANILGSYRLLEYARKRNIEGFLFFSSGAVYGDAGRRQQDINEKEFFPLDFQAISNCYAEGKRAGEAFCKAYFCQYQIPAKIVRIGHTYGPGINLTDGHIYSDFTSWILDSKPLVVHNASAVRSFCYVSDAVSAFFLILLQGADGETYNMANRKETFSAYELAMKLVKEAFPEKRLAVVCEKKNVNVRIATSIDKISALGWQPEIDVVEGFQRTVKSFEKDFESKMQ